jgi:hypothetical protein
MVCKAQYTKVIQQLMRVEIIKDNASNTKLNERKERKKELNEK